MARTHRSVRVDSELLGQLEELARQRAVPVTFAEQVDVGLRLLVQQVTEERVRRSAALVAADVDRAQKTYRQLRGRQQRRALGSSGAGRTGCGGSRFSPRRSSRPGGG